VGRRKSKGILSRWESLDLAANFPITFGSMIKLMVTTIDDLSQSLRDNSPANNAAPNHPVSGFPKLHILERKPINKKS
jgi:hypothetical protein